MRLGLAVAVRLLPALLAAAETLAWAQGAHAQSVRISMVADRTQVNVGNEITLEIRIDAQGGEPQRVRLPDLSDFDELRREVRQPMRFQFGFGGQQQVVQSSTVYTFVLRARRAGRFRLEPVRADLGGRTFTSAPLAIVVADGTGAAPDPGSGSTSLVPLGPGVGQVAPTQPTTGDVAPPTGALDGARYDAQAFLRTVVDKPRPHAGEQVTVTVYLYVRGSIGSSPVASREPSTDGFWVHDLLPATRTLDATQQVVGGVPFRVYVLRRFAAFPLRTGALTIGPMVVDVQTGGFFDIFTGGTPGEQLRREGVPVSLDVQELPAAGRPPGNVRVGRFELEARLDRTQAATGDAVTLTAIVRGSGNLRDIRPDTPVVDGLQFLEPQIQDRIEAPGDLVGGSRTLEWLVVPQRAGRFTIPPFKLSTFEPITGQYRAVETQALTLVAAGNAIAQPSAADDAADDAPRAGTSDDPTEARLGPLRTKSGLSRRVTQLAAEAWFPWLLGGPPFAYLVLVLSQVTRRRLRDSGVARAPQRAVRGARKRLTKARELADAGDARAFYAEVAAALKAVAEARLGEPIGGLTHDKLKAHLVARGAAEDLAARLVDELDGADFARFSASGIAKDEMMHTVDRSQAIIERLEKFTPLPLEDTK